MASSAEQKSFIKEIAPHAIEAYKALGKVYPSICIGMACVESAYGTSKIMRQHNGFLGFKVGSGKTATKYWDGTGYNAKTSEEYTVGVHTQIKAAFRSYKDMRQCVFNFYELLNVSSLYKGVKAGVHYSTQMKQIKEAGYMTSSTEVNSVLSIIARYDLTKYDAEAGAGADEGAGSSLDIEDINMQTIKTGSRGKLVQLWQIVVGIDADGVFGRNTYNATTAFQKAHGLVADGIVGPKTWKAGLESVQ